MQPGIMPGARLKKEDVNYRQHEQCSSCDHYYNSGTCDLVEGNISAQNVCNKWEIKNRSEYRDKEFFQAEYSKSTT